MSGVAVTIAVALALGAGSGSKKRADLPMPPPPVTKAKPAAAPAPPTAEPEPAPPEPAAGATAEPAPRFVPSKKPKVRAGLQVGPGFYLGERANSAYVSGGNIAFKLVPSFQLEWAVAPAFSVQAVLPVTFHLGGYEVLGQRISITGFEIVPAVRGLYELIPRLRLGASLGMGFAHYASRTRVQFLGDIGSDTNYFQVTLGFGGEYALTDKAMITFEPLAFRFNSGGEFHSVSGTTTTSGSAQGYPELALQLGMAFAF